MKVIGKSGMKLKTDNNGSVKVLVLFCRTCIKTSD